MSCFWATFRLLFSNKLIFHNKNNVDSLNINVLYEFRHFLNESFMKFWLIKQIIVFSSFINGFSTGTLQKFSDRDSKRRHISYRSVISKYRHFPRNIDSLGDRAKKRFLRQKSIFIKWSQNIVILPEILIV